MSKARSTTVKINATRLTLGLGAFEKISAVEGVRLTPEMRKDLQDIDRKEMTAEQRTRFINTKYGKKSA